MDIWQYVTPNHEETELIVFVPKSQANAIRNLSIQVNLNEIQSSEFFKNLGIVFRPAPCKDKTG